MPVDSKAALTSDSEVEFVDPRKMGSRDSSFSPSPKKKGKSKPDAKRVRKNGDDWPSQAVIATWRRGDDDMEPSAKMLALLDLLQEWDASGDKTIVYSQCASEL